MKCKKVREFNMLSKCTKTGTKWHEEHRKGLDQQLFWIAMRFKLGALLQAASRGLSGLDANFFPK